MRALLVGYGKMGRAIEAVLLQRGHGVAGRFERGDICLEGKEGKEVAAEICDLAFEFTAPDSAGVPAAAAKHWTAANFSLGVAALRRAVSAAAAALAAFPEFEPGIVERHHAKKKDAPSGTAKMLAATLEEASGRADVPIASLRQGGAPGEHLVFFEGKDETLELVHRARSRAIFAQGAVRAAEWMLASGRKGPLSFDDFFNDASRGGNAP